MFLQDSYLKINIYNIEFKKIANRSGMWSIRKMYIINDPCTETSNGNTIHPVIRPECLTMSNKDMSEKLKFWAL